MIIVCTRTHVGNKYRTCEYTRRGDKNYKTCEDTRDWAAIIIVHVNTYGVVVKIIGHERAEGVSDNRYL